MSSSAVATRWEKIFGVDYRSLALARVMLGLLIFVDLGMRAVDLSAHYTDAGVHPREFAFGMNGYYVCVHMMNGEWSFQAFLFVLHALVALSFAIGYHTRLSAFLLWVLTTSLAARNQLILYGGYVLMRLLTVWFMFLPSHRAWSLDSALKRDPSSAAQAARAAKSPWHVSGFSFALLLQMGVLYASSGWHKTGKEWHEEGSAAWYAISLDYFRWGMGDALLSQPFVLQCLTFATLYWELYGPFLFVSPIAPQFCRLFAVTLFWAMHLGLALALRLSVFLPTFSAALVALLPAFVWDDVLIPLFASPARLRLRVQYDPASAFATRLAQLARFVLVVPSVSVAHLSGETKDVYFKVLAPPVTHTDTSLAFAAVLAHSPFAWPLAPLLRVPLVAQAFDVLAQSQYEKDKHRRAPALAPPAARPPLAKNPAVRLLRRMVALFVGTLLALAVLAWCFGNVGATEYSIPDNARDVVLWLHLDQSWNLFAPRPPAVNFWYTMPGELENGTKVELWKNSAFFDQHLEAPIDPDTYRPDRFADHFINSRWYKWFENVNEGREDVVLPFGRWICRQWNAVYSGPMRLYQYRIIVIWEWNHLNGTHPRAGNSTIWWHVCYDRETPAPAAEEGELRPLREELGLDVPADDSKVVKEAPEAPAEAQPAEKVEEAVADSLQQKLETDEQQKQQQQEPDPVKAEAAEAALRKAEEEAVAEKRAGLLMTELKKVRVVGEDLDAKPFRRPIERLKEIEEEDRRQLDLIEKAITDGKR